MLEVTNLMIPLKGLGSKIVRPFKQILKTDKLKARLASTEAKNSLAVELHGQE